MVKPPARNLLDDQPRRKTPRTVSDADLAAIRSLLRRHARLDLSAGQTRALLAQNAPLKQALLNFGPAHPDLGPQALNALAQSLLRKNWPGGTPDASFQAELYRRAAETGYRLCT